MAPELIKGQKYDSKVDIWALGVLTYIIMTGTEPFQGKSIIEIDKAIKSARVNYEPLQKFHQNGELIRDFLLECFTYSAENRASAEKLL